MATRTEPSAPRPEVTTRRQKPVDGPAHQYRSHLVGMVEKHLAVGPGPMQALDLAASDGFGTIELFAELPQSSRLVALSNDRGDLRVLHEQVVKSDHHGQIFPRKEARDRLPFARHVFDTVWAVLHSDILAPRRPILRQALRVLRPGGQLLVATPLSETIVHLQNTIGARLSKDQQETLLGRGPQLLAAAEWKKELEHCGAMEISVETQVFTTELTAPLSSQHLFCHYLLPLWIGDDPTLQAKALRLLDEAITVSAPVTIHTACFVAHRAMSEAEESAEHVNP